MKIFRFILPIFICVAAFFWFFFKEPLPSSVKKKQDQIEEKSFVIIVPSFNNSLYCHHNLVSILSQEYQNFRVIYIDDHSTDDTLQKVTSFIENHPFKEKMHLISNPQNQGALKNIYTTVHAYCKNNEIVVLVDGDDFLAHSKVLKKLNKVYQDGHVWMTYGNYLDYPSYKQDPAICAPFPSSVIKQNQFRKYKWVASHLKTFYAGLFKKIPQEDLMMNQQFLPMAYDLALMLPLLEMSSIHTKFIKEPLYLYNRSNPLNDHKKDLSLQGKCAAFIKAKAPYSPLKSTDAFLQKERASQ